MPKFNLGRMLHRENPAPEDAEPQYDTPDMDYSDGYDRPDEEYDDYSAYDDPDDYGADGDYYEDYPDEDYPGEDYPDEGYPEDYPEDYPVDYPEDYPEDYPVDYPPRDRAWLPAWLEDAIDYVMVNDWVTWVLLLVLPPVGIWLLWRRGMLNQNGRLLFSLLSGIWLVGALVLLFARPVSPDEAEVMPQNIGRQPLEDTAAEPTPTPLPEVADADAVYILAEGAFYHRLSDCQLIGKQSPARVARSTAQEAGLMSCPYCAGGTYGVPDTLYMSVDTADLSNQQVYCSSADETFHIDLDCPARVGSQHHLVGLKEALLMNKTACQSCCAVAARKFYCTADGTYYHVEDDCSGMRNARQVTYAEARVLGKVRCPKCIGGTPEVNATPASANGSEDTTYYVYATKNGKYYHIEEHCSGMQNAQRVKLSDMLSSGRAACPTCCTAVEMTVYAGYNNPYYHSTPTCSGLTDPITGTLVQALAAGLTRCPICWLAS